MNKIYFLVGVVLLCAACVPPVQAPAPATPVAVVVPAPTPPKAGVIDMPADPVVEPKATKTDVKVKPMISIEVYPGSLKENIERIAGHSGWHQVVWDAPQDFLWVGKAKIQGENLSSILNQLLADYPLQAIFYQGNHVLYIHPRTLK